MAMAIQERMDEKEMNQTMLSEASGVKYRRLNDHVRGQHSPELTNLSKLCKALDTTVDKMMNRAEDLLKELSQKADS